MQITDELYRQSLKIINWQVNKHAVSHPELDRNDVISEANYIFCMAALNFDPNRGAQFSSYLVSQLKRLGDLSNRTHAPTKVGCEKSLWVSLDAVSLTNDYDRELDRVHLDSSERMAEADQMCDFAPFLDMLSDKARILYNDILDGKLDANPNRIAKDGQKAYNRLCLLSPSLIRSRKYTKEGWTKKEAESAFNELSSAIRNWKLGHMPSRLVKPGRRSASHKRLFDLALMGA